MWLSHANYCGLLKSNGSNYKKHFYNGFSVLASVVIHFRCRRGYLSWVEDDGVQCAPRNWGPWTAHCLCAIRVYVGLYLPFMELAGQMCALIVGVKFYRGIVAIQALFLPSSAGKQNVLTCDKSVP